MGRVLVIEDDRRSSAEIAAALGDHGFDVECAYNGRDGLLKATADKYDAVVLDRMLPGDLDGLGVLATLRRVCGLRMLAVKNSRKRIEARSPAATTSAGTAAPFQVTTAVAVIGGVDANLAKVYLVKLGDAELELAELMSRRAELNPC